MKVTLTFNLPEEREEFETAVNAAKYKAALWEVGQRIFRPARKHGYSDTFIQECLDNADESRIRVHDDGNCFLYESGAGTELVSALEKLFYRILEEEGVEI